ncbi:unnamed protein product [Microthlaspi erraticum]|uniref:F-box domain-containing protein n=1 Tax=Microthlaspi erraticum TaxID=1685480 RepID=A0A6D2KKF0_9BRAS|nr:unnamed protein product [Microthlaspi erraticum]
MMITDLPMDLVEEIISKIPVKSMKGVQLTCTMWNTLSKSQILTKMHLGKAFAPAKEDESRIIMMIDEKIYLTSVFVNNDVKDFSAEKIGQLTCLEEQVKISNVCQCEGLLLCMLKGDDTRVVVWNPYLGQTRWIQLRRPHVPSGKTRHNMFSYGLGYENKMSGRSLKLLRFIDFSLFENKNEFLWYEIYDFESGLWTTLDVNPYWRVLTSGCGLSFKGNSYWCATKRNSESGWREYQYIDHIICFDYTRNRFGPLLRLPDRYDYVTLSCVREEKLAALCCRDDSDPYDFRIWITTLVEAGKVSWSKFLTFYQELHPDDIRFSFGGFYVDQVKKVAMLSGRRVDDQGSMLAKTVCIIRWNKYEGGADLEECTEESSWLKLVGSYVPSLVQVKEPKGGQRQKQSDLENFRYDEREFPSLYLRCKSLNPHFSV